MTTVPSGVKNQTGIFKWPIKLYSHRWKITCSLINAFQPIADKPIVSSTIQLSLLNLSISALLGGGNVSVVDYVFSFTNANLFFLSNPQTESTESGSQTSIRKGLEPRLKTEIPLENQVFSIALKEFAIKLFKAQAVGEALARKKPCH